MPLFGAKLLNTTVEVMCQTTGQTFTITTNKPKKQCRCWKCGDDKGSSEAFIVELGPGKGNVSVTYYGMDGSQRKLEKVVSDLSSDSKHSHFGLAQYTADGGTFILLSQEDY